MLIQTADPKAEPVSLVQAKLHLRLDPDNTAEDAYISALITTARRYAESYTGRSFITQSWRLVVDSFPGPSLTGIPWGSTYSIPAHALVLERGVVQSVTSITYMDMTGVWQTMDPANYVADLSGCPARITPVFGQIWPIPRPQIGSVKVDYVAGYGDTASAVPSGIAQWMLLRVGTMYENREEVAILARGKVEQLPYVDALLDPYRVEMV